MKERFQLYFDPKHIKSYKILNFMILGHSNHFLALFIAHQLITAAHRRNTETTRSFLHGALVCTNIVTKFLVDHWVETSSGQKAARSLPNQWNIICSNQESFLWNDWLIYRVCGWYIFYILILYLLWNIYPFISHSALDQM